MRYRTILFLFFKKILLHGLLWLGVLVFFSYFFENTQGEGIYISSFAASLLPVTIVTTYTLIYFLIPNFLLREKYLLFILYCFYLFILSAFAIFVSVFYGLVFLLDMQYHSEGPLSKSLLFVMVVVYLVVLLITGIKLLQYNYSAAAKNKELENRILETQLKLKEQELNFLKMQIHPHFLFNTLNTIYGHALQKSEKAPGMILKLSNLLDYLLYQVDKPLVKLSDEVEHLKDYIELEQMRFRTNLSIEMAIPNTVHEIFIAPMIFIPLVENSFKHGEIVDGKLEVYIELKIKEEFIFFNIKNSNRTETKKNAKSGIGLQNLRKRLELFYKDKHSFIIDENANWYQTKLMIKTIIVNHYEK